MDLDMVYFVLVAFRVLVDPASGLLALLSEL